MGFVIGFILVVVLVLIRRVIIRGGVHLTGKAIGSAFPKDNALNKPVSGWVVNLSLLGALVLGAVGFVIYLKFFS
jgi:hypothetical protein